MLPSLCKFYSLCQKSPALPSPSDGQQLILQEPAQCALLTTEEINCTLIFVYNLLQVHQKSHWHPETPHQSHEVMASMDHDASWIRWVTPLSSYRLCKLQSPWQAWEMCIFVIWEGMSAALLLTWQGWISLSLAIVTQDPAFSSVLSLSYTLVLSAAQVTHACFPGTGSSWPTHPGKAGTGC